jgi:hypothetical protein
MPQRSSSSQELPCVEDHDPDDEFNRRKLGRLSPHVESGIALADVPEVTFAGGYVVVLWKSTSRRPSF